MHVQVPFIAHRQLGDTYKWLLYGDDDTVWFMDGVLKFLEDLDPDMPYFISGAPPTQSNNDVASSNPSAHSQTCSLLVPVAVNLSTGISLICDLLMLSFSLGADHLWWSSAPGRASHPHPGAPRCLPCNYPDAYMDKSKAPFR